MLLALTLRRIRQAPTGLLLVLLGIAVAYYQTGLEQVEGLSWQLPSLSGFRVEEVWTAMVLAGFAQIPLTATNAVLSVSSLIKTYFPDRSVGERNLSLNMGLANLVLPFLGAMPMCHGAGGLAAKYYFGARSGGANILEGGFFIYLGLFAASSITSIFNVFPQAVIGAMLLLVGLEMVKFAREVPLGWETAPLAVTVIVAVITNMGYGFLAGMAFYYLLQLWLNHREARKQRFTP